jgi:hypothetical protein
MVKGFRKLWPVLFLLPGLLAALATCLASKGRDTFSAWCAAYWWQLFFFGALAYFAATLVRWAFSWIGRRAHRPDA